MKRLSITIIPNDDKYKILAQDKYLRIDFRGGELMLHLSNINPADVLDVMDKSPYNHLHCCTETCKDAMAWLLPELDRSFNKVQTNYLFAFISNVYINYLKNPQDLFETIDGYDYKKIFQNYDEKIAGALKRIRDGNSIFNAMIITYLLLASELLVLTGALKALAIYGGSFISVIGKQFFEFANHDIQHIGYKLAIIDGKITPCYILEDTLSIVVFETFNILEKKVPIKKCKNCDKVFIPINRSDAIYCDSSSPQDETRTCKEYGSQKLWYDKLRNDEAKKLARNIYTAKQLLAKRHEKDDDPVLYEIYKKSFEEYKSQSKQWKIDVKAGTKTELEFIEWLKSVKEKRVL